MKVLLGIVSWNREKLLPAAINSALRQQDVSLKVAVYDDNSTDGTRELVTKYPTVHWTFGNTNRGYLYARNKLMREANADYFCSLDDDSWFTADHDLSAAVTFLDEHPEVSAVAFDILSLDRPHRAPLGSPIETANFIGCGHVLRLAHVQEVGYYESNPGSYGGEEKDLCIRLIDRGYKVFKLPGVHVWHEKTSIARDVKRQHRSAVYNDLVFAYRRTPGILLIPALVAKFLSHLRFGIKYEKGYVLKSTLMAILDFHRILFSFGLQRRPVRVSTLKKFRRLSQG
jgi:GT2 family glycosyltransferase